MAANENNNNFFLLKSIPVVLRARGFRLYTEGNRRLIDLWLNGGAAVLGHTPANMLRELKNTASRGLYAPFPHFTEGRFIKALLKLFPGRYFRLYASPPPELVSLFSAGKACLWRPFCEPEKNAPPVFIPVLPGIQSWRGGLPLGLCVVATESEEQLAPLPPNDILSPILLVMAARGVYDLLASPLRAKPILPKTFKALQKSRWKRHGVYLYLNESAQHEEWQALFRQFLEAGFLLPPCPSQPVILPGELSAGEDSKLAAVLSFG